MSRLFAQPFSENLRYLVLDFDAGTEAWDVAEADWIKASLDSACGAVFDLQKYPETEVWLFRLADGTVVGFGSIGTTTWTLPPQGGQKTLLTVIPHLAIRKEFQGGPSQVRKEDRYSRQIMDDLLSRSMERPYAMIGLFVHENNLKAIRLYEQYGFEMLPSKVRKVFRQMVRRLE